MLSFSLGKCNIGVFIKLLIRGSDSPKEGVIMLVVQEGD